MKMPPPESRHHVAEVSLIVNTKILLALLSAIVLSLFAPWEMAGETTMYWFFARVFAETGQFIIPDRSPLYTLYLNAFMWLGYPTSVTVEYIVTSLIVLLALVGLLKPYLGLWPSVLGSILWIPFMQFAEPAAQKLALACSCWGVMLRRPTGQQEKDRFRFVASYTLFILAYSFRSTYAALILTFAVWDVFQIIRRNGFRSFVAHIRPRQSDLLILFVVALFVWFSAMQSPHPWNNSWAASPTWLPAGGKSLMDAAFLHSFSGRYIVKTYGIEWKDKDSYFAIQELFGGARTVLEAIWANPRFVIEQVLRNLKGHVGVVASLTMIQGIFRDLPILLVIIYGVFRMLRLCNDMSLKMFILAGFILTAATSVWLPNLRYMVPLVPILILGGFWYGLWAGERIRHLVDRYQPSLRRSNLILAFSRMMMPAALFLFSPGARFGGWAEVLGNLAGNIRQGEIRVLERGYLPSEPVFAMKASFEGWHPLVRGCKGILSLESTFVGAFAKVPLDRVYDVWEIPPFGHLGDSVYDGLRPDRIDCVLVSDVLANEVGMGTNFRIRYESYIKPYVRQLQGMGAMTYDIPRFGQAIILPKSEGKV